MSKYKLVRDDHPWINKPDNMGDVGDLREICDELNRLLSERDEAREHWGTESMNAAQFLSEKTKAIAERDEAREQNAKLLKITEKLADELCDLHASVRRNLSEFYELKEGEK